VEKLPASLADNEIEEIERSALRALWIATRDFGPDAWEFFRQSTDDPKDIAEDVTREMLDRLGGYGIPQRIYGNVDYRKARYVINPDIAVRQALFVDSKAEKSCSTATLQMSQISLTVEQNRGNTSRSEPGLLQSIQNYGGNDYLSTTLLSHYHYSAQQGNDGKDRPPYILKRITICAVPNGKLQGLYNPNPSDSIWVVGRNSEQRGESFRVRLSFSRLESKCSWRVQKFDFGSSGAPTMMWRD